MFKTAFLQKHYAIISPSGKLPVQQFSSICASTFTDVFALHFEVKFDQLFVQRVLRSRLTSNL